MKKFLCKAILNRKTTSNTGLDWAISKRCLLEMCDSYFKIGDKKILFSEINSSTLKKIPSAFFWPGYILSIKMKDGTSHHFGLIYSKYWNRDFPFPVERTTGKVPLLWVRRAIIIAAIIYILYTTFLS